MTYRKLDGVERNSRWTHQPQPDQGLSALIGQSLVRVGQAYGGLQNNDFIRFDTDQGVSYVLTHIQDCCELVSVEDITGDLQDLVGSEIVMAEVASNQTIDEKYDHSTTWTFYKFATGKGFVTIRFRGESNGYYSQRVSVFELDRPEAESNYPLPEV